jgi:hypothetical protein
MLFADLAVAVTSRTVFGSGLVRISAGVPAFLNGFVAILLSPAR